MSGIVCALRDYEAEFLEMKNLVKSTNQNFGEFKDVSSKVNKLT
jgi:hypothetical protein